MNDYDLFRRRQLIRALEDVMDSSGPFSPGLRAVPVSVVERCQRQLATLATPGGAGLAGLTGSALLLLLGLLETGIS